MEIKTQNLNNLNNIVDSGKVNSELEVWFSQRENKSQKYTDEERSAVKSLVNDILLPRTVIRGHGTDTPTITVIKQLGGQEEKDRIQNILGRFDSSRSKVVASLAQWFINHLGRQVLEERSVSTRKDLQERSIGVPQRRESGTDPLRFLKEDRNDVDLVDL